MPVCTINVSIFTLEWENKVQTNFLSLQESLRQSAATRFYVRQRDDPHGPNIAVYVGNLPTGWSQREYEKILLDIVGTGKFWCLFCGKQKVMYSDMYIFIYLTVFFALQL